MISENEILILLSGIIFLGFIGEIAFRKKRIPDMLLLLLIGILIHYSGIIPLKYLLVLREFVGLFGTIALILIVFGGLLKINFMNSEGAISKGITVAIVDVVFIIATLTPILYYIFHISLLESLLISAILSETSVTFITPLIERVRLDEKIRNMVKIETIFNSVLNIIAVLLIIDIINNNSSFIGITSYLFASISEGIVLGGVVGLLWLITLKQAITPHYYMVTVAILFLLWGLSNYLNASPILSIFTFAIIISTSGQISKVIKIAGKVDTDKLTMFNDEISFFVLSFFYVYIGTFVNIFDIKSLIFAAIITLTLAGLRYAEIYSIDLATKWIGNYRNILSSFSLRGSTVVVLLGVLLSLDPNLFNEFSNTIFFIVVLSIMVGSVLFSIHSRKLEGKND
ncbi:MAG: cation:proton antiporter [Thermoplasmata archaeon]